jgi:hypothetical protein
MRASRYKLLQGINLQVFPPLSCGEEFVAAAAPRKSA